MSDPVTRRARAVETLVRNLSTVHKGWTIEQCSSFLVKLYGYGIRRRTAAGIVRELVELGVLYRKGTRFYVKKE